MMVMLILLLVLVDEVNQRSEFDSSNLDSFKRNTKMKGERHFRI